MKLTAAESSDMSDAISGWNSQFQTFTAVPLATILEHLHLAASDPSPQQSRAWKESIPQLQKEVTEVVGVDSAASAYTAVLEYQLPMEFRRADAVFLMHDAVVVVELKGKQAPNVADLDQAQAYARDLRAYHAVCADRDVHAVLVPTAAKGQIEEIGGVTVCPPHLLDGLLVKLNSKTRTKPVDPRAFLSEDSYRPLPTLVKAARELFSTGELRRVKRAAAATEAATNCLLQLVRDAARSRRRKLIVLSGVPGAGKTLVGLRLVHSHEIDDLAVARENGKPTAPAVFLSGNGPLVEVLAYELKDAGGSGRTFVRGVKQYVERYLRNSKLVPPEHVLVYDEAQRAYDKAMVAEKHSQDIEAAKSEPEHFIEFAERVPEWCVVLALIGNGQEIHKGEEAGTEQWADAIRNSPRCSEWDVHGPTALAKAFSVLPYEVHPELNLDRSLRSHLAFEVHKLVAGIVGEEPAVQEAPPHVAEMAPPYVTGIKTSRDAMSLANLAQIVAAQGHHLRITRDLTAAKQYLRDRYGNDPTARYGLLASSRDRDLVRFGVQNDFQSTKRTKFGPWYGDDEVTERGWSCRHLRECVTEFGAQGLELDGALLAWGTDFFLRDGKWSVERASKYQRKGAPVRNPAQLRANSYRVLLTRARDVTVVFMPPLVELNETYGYLKDCGFQELS